MFRYFAVSGCPKEYADLVQHWSKMGYPSERDLFLCRAVLHTLSCGRYRENARTTSIIVCTATWPSFDRYNG